MNPHTQNPAKLQHRIAELEQTLKDLEIHILSAMMNDERDDGGADVSLPWMLESIRAALRENPTNEGQMIMKDDIAKVRKALEALIYSTMYKDHPAQSQAAIDALPLLDRIEQRVNEISSQIQPPASEYV